MNSIIINNFSLPASCAECRFVRKHGDFCSCCINDAIINTEQAKYHREKWCPLKENMAGKNFEKGDIDKLQEAGYFLQKITIGKGYACPVFQEDASWEEIFDFLGKENK